MYYFSRACYALWPFCCYFSRYTVTPVIESSNTHVKCMKILKYMRNKHAFDVFIQNASQKFTDQSHKY